MPAEHYKDASQPASLPFSAAVKAGPFVFVSGQVAKGDFVMVPEKTPHWFSAIDGTVVLMSLHLPHKPAQ